MPDPAVLNPAGAYRNVSDFTTWADANGHEIEYWRQVATLRANGTINKFDAVMFVAPTTTVPLSVAQLATTAGEATALKFVGVALEAGTAGGYIRIATSGFAMVQIGSATPAAYDVATNGGSAAGAVGTVAAGSVAATNIVGSIYGVFLGGTQTFDGIATCAPLWISRF